MNLFLAILVSSSLYWFSSLVYPISSTFFYNFPSLLQFALSGFHLSISLSSCSFSPFHLLPSFPLSSLSFPLLLTNITCLPTEDRRYFAVWEGHQSIRSFLPSLTQSRVLWCRTGIPKAVKKKDIYFPGKRYKDCWQEMTTTFAL